MPLPNNTRKLESNSLSPRDPIGSRGFSDLRPADGLPLPRKMHTSDRPSRGGQGAPQLFAHDTVLFCFDIRLSGDWVLFGLRSWNWFGIRTPEQEHVGLLSCRGRNALVAYRNIGVDREFQRMDFHGSGWRHL